MIENVSPKKRNSKLWSQLDQSGRKLSISCVTKETSILSEPKEIQSAKMCGWLKHLDDYWINGHRCNKTQWALVLSLQLEEISRVHNWWRTNCLACHKIIQTFMLSIQQQYTYLCLQIFAVYNAFSYTSSKLCTSYLTAHGSIDDSINKEDLM